MAPSTGSGQVPGPRISAALRPGWQGRWIGVRGKPLRPGWQQEAGGGPGFQQLFPFFRYYSLTRQVPRPISAPSTPEVRLPRPADSPPKRSKRRNRRGTVRDRTFHPFPLSGPPPQSAIRSATLCAALCANGPDSRTPSGSTLRFRRAMLAHILPGGAAPGVDRRSRLAGRSGKIPNKIVFAHFRVASFQRFQRVRVGRRAKKNVCLDRYVNSKIRPLFKGLGTPISQQSFKGRGTRCLACRIRLTPISQRKSFEEGA